MFLYVSFERVGMLNCNQRIASIVNKVQ